MSGSPFGIGEYLSAQNQADAAQHAADVSASSSKYGIDMMLKMWEQAQSDFAPFLQSGYQGLAGLTQQMPQYLNQVLQPLAQQISSYQLSNMPSATTGMVNPVTGEITQYSPIQSNNISQMQVPSNQYSMPQANQSGFTQNIQRASLTQPTTERTTQDIAPKMYIDVPNYAGDKTGVLPQTTRQKQTINPEYVNWMRQNDQQQASQQAVQQPTQNTYNPLGYTIPRLTGNAVNNGFNSTTMQNVGATQDQLSQGGVLSPLVPEFQRPLDYTFDVNDPIYQIKAKQIQDRTNAFLAKQGLGGSTAGNTYANSQLQNLMAQEDASQYARALAERNYMTQTDLDRYKAESERGNTLYGRQYQSGQDLYNRALSGSQLYDQQQLGQLSNIYGLANNLYGMQYAGNLDLTKIGQGAAGSTGQASLSTGQGVNQAYQNMGTNAANGLLAQSNIWANYMNGLSNQGSQVGNQLMNYFGNQGGGSYGNYYSGGSGAGTAAAANNMWGGDTSWAAFY